MKKRVFIYGVGIFFSKILVFLIVPIYTRVFSTGDFGYYDVLISNMQMIVSITFIEIWSGIIRFMFEGEDRYKPIKTMLCMIPVLIGLYAVGVFVLNIIFKLKYSVITVIYGILYFLFNVSNSICRGLEQNTKYVISGGISTFISCVLCIVFAVGLHLGIEYLLIAQSIGYFLAVIYVEFTTKAYRKAMHSTYQIGSIKEISLYCVPLMLNSFSYLFLGTFNKNIIINQLGESQSGVYAYVGKFSAIVVVLLSVYALAWQEQAFISAEDEDRERQYSHYLNKFIMFAGLGIPVYIIVCIIFSPWLGGSQYLDSERYIPLAILGSYISNFSGVISTVIAVKKKTNFILYSTVIGAIINVIVASLTIRLYGINASALSLCIGFWITAFLRLYFAKKDFDLQIQWRYFLLMLFEVMVILIIIYVFGSKLAVNMWIAIITLVIWMIINIKSIKSIVTAIAYKIRRKNNG